MSRPTPATRLQSTLLPNGLTIVSASQPHRASVALGIWVGNGGRHEPEPLNGISHFIEHLLFKGTRRRNAAQISQAVEGIGGYLNAFTDEEHTCFYARAQAHHLPHLLEVLSDMFTNSRLAEVEITKEREVIKEEVAMYLDQPAEHVADLLNAGQFPGHALGRPVLGTPKSLDRLKRSVFVDYLRRSYTTGATVIAAAGAVEHRQLVELVTRHCRTFREGGRVAYEPVTHQPTAPVLIHRRRRVEQTALCLGIRTCSRHDERRFALRLLNAILGENMSSRLFQVVREQHGLTYNIHSSLSFWDDCGDCVISAGLDEQQVRKTLKLVLQELARLRDRAPAAGELRRARDFVIGQMELHLEGTENQMMAIGEQWLAHGRLTSPSESRDRLAKVTASQIRAVAEAFIRPANLTLASVSPGPKPVDLLPLLERS
jgi:predicted Zn-dependent peptidase